MICVYLAGPFSSAPVANTARALAVAEQLRAAGFAVFVPHALYAAWDAHHPLDYEAVMDQCLAWTRRSDALLRIPGVSPGADREVRCANELGLPVFHRVEDVIAWAAR